MTRMILMLTAPCVSYKASSAAFFCLCDQSNTFWERCSILSASDDLGQIKPRKYYSPFSSELPLNFVANFPIHKISLNLFVIISKTFKIYNPFFVLLINGHFESMVAVSDFALPTYFPPFKSSSADRPTQLVFYVFFWLKRLSWSERRLTGLPDTIKMWHPSIASRELFLTFVFFVFLGRIRYALKNKLRDYLGIFPIGGGRVFPIPKTFVNWPSVFLHAKFRSFWGRKTEFWEFGKNVLKFQSTLKSTALLGIAWRHCNWG